MLRFGLIMLFIGVIAAALVAIAVGLLGGRLIGTSAAVVPPSASVPASSSASAPTIVISPAGRGIVGVGSGLCITPVSAGAGARLELASCDASPGQLWQVASDGTIRSQGMCMDVGSGTGNGTQVVRDACTGSGNQVFDLNGAGDLTSTGTGYLCVDATGRATAPGTLLQLWQCSGASNQKWRAAAGS